MIRSENAKTAAASARRNVPHRICVFLKETFLTLRFADGTEIAAFGSNAYPESYQAGYAAIRDCFDPIIKRHRLLPWDEDTRDPRKKATP